jgi:hypothetical protein
MLLQDIGKSPDATFRRINQHLQNNYGFKVSEDTSDKDLNIIIEQIQEEINDLKIKGDDARSSSEISKRLLILESIRSLKEYAIMQQSSVDVSPDEERVIKWMIDFVVDNFKISGDFDDSIKDAMKQYRSSRYRFPDSDVEQAVRHGALLNIGKFKETAMAETNSGLMFEDVAQEEAIDEELGEEDKVPMIRDKSGNMVKDPFAAQAAARNKGTAMKEHANLVKNLRRLLETEVSQAEVMMSAKNFATELQEMVEKIGRLQNEDLPPVTDKMRETYGMESASTFQTQIYGSFQHVMDALYTAKGQVDEAVANLATTGSIGAEVDMDLDPAMTGDMGADPMAGDMGGEADLDNIGSELDGMGDDTDAGLDAEPQDEFGSEEALGRSKKMESVLQKKVMEMKKLVAKAKKLKESRK